MLDETVPQGDVRLLETDTARRLLATPVPARLAYTAKDGTPRVIPINFVWTGDELVMGALPAATR
jgi:nitroimidazol reductase NimA-like FMN-containing flavoprotein (pyridoxamine 5'-phosphate oxidase superfamily)